MANQECEMETEECHVCKMFPSTKNQDLLRISNPIPLNLVREIAKYLDLVTKCRLRRVSTAWNFEFHQSWLTSPVILDTSQLPVSTLSGLLYSELDFDTKVRKGLAKAMGRHNSKVLVFYCASKLGNRLRLSDGRLLCLHMRILAYYAVSSQKFPAFPKIIFHGGLVKGIDLLRFFLHPKTSTTFINREMAVLNPQWLRGAYLEGTDLRNVAVYGTKEEKTVFTQDPMLQYRWIFNHTWYRYYCEILDSDKSPIRKCLKQLSPKPGSEEFVTTKITKQFQEILNAPMYECLLWAAKQ